MKNILIIKTSSLGDVVHTLPALTDALKMYPDLRVDWVVEEGFTEIPLWHAAVDKVFPLGLRRWRRTPIKSLLKGEWLSFIENIRAKKYDLVIDAQGLFKSAVIGCFAKGHRVGLNSNSAKEPLASLLYQTKIDVPREQHAVARLRILFAKILDYPVPTQIADYGIRREKLTSSTISSAGQIKDSIVFLHGTTWDTKHWPERYWCELGEQITQDGYKIVVPWGNAAEKHRAEKIAADNPNIHVLPKMGLSELTSVLAFAKGVVAVDTGLGHITAALGVPALSIYGATKVGLTGSHGQNQIHVQSTLACSPCLSRTCHYKEKSLVFPACYQEIHPALVWGKLKNKISTLSDLRL